MGMNTAIRRSLRHRLIKRDGNLCHYCEDEMDIPTSPRLKSDDMTLEHIVPQSYGGENLLDNLVLACSDCNNARGNELDFCWCPRCQRVMQRWFNRKFESLINANKPRVKFHSGMWRVRVGKASRTFLDWNSAIQFALTGDNQ